MSNGLEISAVGNLGADIELRYSASGNAWASFSVGVTERQTIRGERKDTTTWLRCKIFGEAAEHAAESLSKGSRVIVLGKMRQEDWTTSEGEKRSTMSVIVDEIGPSLRFAQAKVTRIPRPDGGQGGYNGGGQGGGYSGGGQSGASRGGDFGGGRSNDFGGGDANPWGGDAPAGGDPFGDDNPFGPN